MNNRLPGLSLCRSVGQRVWIGLWCVFLFLWIGIGGGVAPVWAQGSVNYGNANLARQDLSHQDFRNTVFVGANLRRSDLSGSNLMGATLTKTNLSYADLEGCDLTAALLDLANLEHANLRDANLTAAILTRADLYEADVTGADFSEAFLDRSTVNYLCEFAEGIHPITGVATRDSLGCRD